MIQDFEQLAVSTHALANALCLIDAAVSQTDEATHLSEAALWREHQCKEKIEVQ